MRVFKADFDPFFGSMAPSVLGMLVSATPQPPMDTVLLCLTKVL